MSRTVLFSEVDEVSDRFPDYVAEIREVFLHAHLPESAEDRLPAIADRIATDEVFREDLASMLTTVCALEPQISHLEALGILVVAAVGPEQARVLAERPGVDLSARQIFNFVLEARRRRRDVVEDGEVDGAESLTGDEETGVSEPVFGMTEDRTPEPVFAAEAYEVAIPEKPVVTASTAGVSSMLARALALAADEEGQPVPPAVQASLRAVPTESVQEAEVPAEPAVRSERVVRRAELPRVVRAPEPVGQDPEQGLELEQDEVPPRRWGMWTAAACGVLLGFGLGVFAHFDHRTATPTAAQSAADAVEPGAAVQIATASVPAPPKHMTLAEELRADLALLGPRSRPERVAASHAAGREQTRAVAQPSARTREARHGAAPAEQPRPTLVVRSPEPAGAAAAGTQPSARIVATGNGPAPLVASVRPVSLAGVADPGNAVARSAGAVALPRVTTGSAGVMAANLISSPAPAYPMAASAAGVQGEVIVEAVVGRDGGVVDTRVVSGPMLLRAAALDAVQRWHYRPYEVDGKPIEVATTARLEFRLDH